MSETSNEDKKLPTEAVDPQESITDRPRPVAEDNWRTTRLPRDEEQVTGFMDHLDREKAEENKKPEEFKTPVVISPKKAA